MTVGLQQMTNFIIDYSDNYFLHIFVYKSSENTENNILEPEVMSSSVLFSRPNPKIFSLL